MAAKTAGETRSLYSHEKLHNGENANSIRMDERFVYSHSGKAYPRTPPRDRNHVRERRLPFIKMARAKGHHYYYFVAPYQNYLGRLPHPDAVDFDHTYLKFLALMEGEGIPDYQHPVRSFVYFIGCEHAIKIGVAKCVEKRFATLQTHSPVILKVLAVSEGALKEEQAYHRQFKAHRLHGEWFNPHPDILAEIARLGAPA